MKQQIKDLLVYAVIGVLFVTMYVWGYSTGIEHTRRVESIVRLRTVCERQRVMRDVGFYTGDIDNVRGDLTIAAEKQYYRWYAHCMAAGKRVDPNVIEWENTLNARSTNIQREETAQ